MITEYFWVGGGWLPGSHFIPMEHPGQFVCFPYYYVHNTRIMNHQTAVHYRRL